jgi:dihydrolipoamide dehydrogenase
MVVGDFTQGVQLVIIGAGPGGYVAAIRAAQLGLEVTLIEDDHVGGVCLNWGCIPSKALIHVADMKSRMEHAKKMGLTISGIKVDLEKMMGWKRDVVEKLRNGVATLLNKHGVDLIHGKAMLTGESSISVETDEGVQRYEFENLILATGSSPITPPFVKLDGKRIVESKDALEINEIPEHFVVIGAGAVGLEMGMVYSKLGSKVIILDAADSLLPTMSREVGKTMQKALQNHGIDLVLSAKVLSVEENQDGLELKYEVKGSSVKIRADRILVAIGRKPNTEGLGLDKAGVKTDEKGFIPVNEKMRTNKERIYAIGDLVQGMMLAHRASFQGKVAAEVIAGEPSAYEGVEAPAVIFSDPEIASVGLTEQEARDRGLNVKSGVFPFKALGRTLTMGEDPIGFTKVVSDEDTGTVLGVHIVGPNASDLISEGALAVASASHIDDLQLTIHPHPTFSEGIEEAAEQVERRAIHIFSPPETSKSQK